MNAAEISAMQSENFILKAKVSTICKVYSALRPVLNFLKVFAFIKKGGKVAIEGAIAVLDGVCETNN